MKELNSSFLKWIGNKKASTKFIISKFPKDFNHYFEPFVGSGYIYFNILKSQHSTISDINPELINLYNVIKYNLNELLEQLFFYDNNLYTFEYLKNLDRHDNYPEASNILKATRFLYININSLQQFYKTDLNGLCINTYNKNNLNKTFDLHSIKLANLYLQNTNIYNFNYEHILPLVKEKDLIYLDPPYFDNTLNFHYNNHNKFLFEDHIKLKEFCDKLNEKKAYFFLSNYALPEIIDLYKEYNQHIIDFKFKSKKEILISNFRN